MRVIELTKGQVAIVDDEDFGKLAQWHWYCGKNGYAYRRLSKAENERKPLVLMHREIMNSAKGECVDHINGNPLDNRRCNLRRCTHAENLRNRKLSRTNKIGFKGVFYRADKGKFVAYITKDGKRKHIGYFATAEDANEAYVEHAARLFGEFARKN